MRNVSIPTLALILAPAIIALLVSTPHASAAAKKAPVAGAETAGTSATTSAAAPGADQVWIKINDGSIACDDPKMARTLEKSRALLDAEQVKVFDSKSANDGKMRAAVCGIPKGNEHHFLISKKDLKRAEGKGFQLDPDGASAAGASGASNR